MQSFKVNNIVVPEELPLIALKNTVLFPKIVMPVIIQRQKSVAALDAALLRDNLVFFTAQRNIEDDVTPRDLMGVGTIGRVMSVFKLPDGSSKIDVEGVARARIVRYSSETPHFSVAIEPLVMVSSGADDLHESVLVRRIIDQFRRIFEMRSFPGIPPEAIYMMAQIKDAEQVISLVTSNLNIDAQEQQRILEMTDAREALQQLNLYLTRELDILDAEKSIAKETKKKIGKMQKEVFLREQLKSIEKELGVEDEQVEFDVIRKKVLSAKMPKEIEEKAIKELNRLAKMPAFSPEVSYVRNYLDWLTELPWEAKVKDAIDLKKAEKILNQDHYGLDKAKERIVEYLAVKKQVKKLKGPILCFVGPPGVGKTSIGQSIAKALGRKFVRVSLGGLRDEAEIRGHRRTYVGAMPGRIVQGIHSAKSKNPVFMLDEIDKVGADFRGDPSAALLEALDPEQNHAFSDHYLEVPYDLSDVLFIATANSLETIPPALRDRLEVISFAGYTEQEKLKISQKFLMPKLISDHGLSGASVKISDKVIGDIIHFHTMEAGVRELERQLGTIIRKITRNLVEAKSKRSITVTADSLHKYLGPVKYTHQSSEKKDEIGVATGMAWSPYGGSIITIESAKMPGRGRLILTGQQGSVMQESAQAALTYARGRVAKDGNKEDFNKMDVHVHVPVAGRKDGPSAGTAITTSLVSLFTGVPIRKDVAMTGEVTLRGKVLEIGGIKEKVLAAHRAGIKTVIMPAENKKDLEEIPKEVRKTLKVVFAKTMDDVLKVALK
ncbi:MAG: endopeptidase La [Patescibacteria group bacterium]